ncbi:MULTISPECIES: cold-shock protein [Cellulophaga]|jgi:cold shock CspA family protein|uniref:Cold-shock DNA-binding protein family n=2 Tax=Cellulophaga baltica TaxID=76594 RepID=A0A1G7G8E2_9FLAO|nr:MULTISPECIES: cold shock domain-containing protein [Cellulophaga]AIY14713.1 DNA-binding protein [Cellulophaga baltica NN016038]AIZ43087.1 DNA-binding protein [Cellulophaga baltica 18]KGK31597.1 DNA-binding protein [Cellulophaga sp. E6(2014)]MBA6315638.1 cold shock domain-containing protein [Cellulophaga baltica]MCR1024069.1 cold shock domain-containing protein [Cellulophaga baltica]
MARAQETFGKKEREKKRLKKREEKAKKKEQRKASGEQDSMFVYVDENGHLVDTPPDPSKKVKVDAESIVLGIPKKEESDEEIDPVRKGRVEFFNDSKGYGFIKDSETQEKFFVHVQGCLEEIKENNMVQFELERGMKGMNAVRVKKV